MRSSKIAVLCLLVASAAGCPFVTSGTGNGFSGATGGSGAAGGTSSGATTSSSTGSASSSSSGTGGGSVCKAGDMMSCYTGPSGTENVGPCKAGYETCQQDGSGWGGCVMQTLPKPDNCASGQNLGCLSPAPTCTGSPSAAGKAWGEPGVDVGLGVAIDSKGNTIVSGSFHATLDFGNGKPLSTADGGSDGFVAQYDPTGKLNWVVQIGASGDDEARAVVLDANDNVFVAGGFATQVTFATSTKTTVTGGPGIFVAKLDSGGTPQWASGYVGMGSHAANAVALGADGKTLAVAGATAGSFVIGATMINTTGMGDVDGYVFTLDAATGQNVGWVRQIYSGSGSEDQYLTGAALDPTDGSVVITGYGTGDTHFDATSGAATRPGNGQNVILGKYDASGTITWKQLYGQDNTTDAGRAVTVGSNGDVFVTGSFQQHLAFGAATAVDPPSSAMQGATAMFVARLDRTSKGVWAKAFGPNPGGGVASGLGVAADDFGVLVGGYFTDTLLGGAATPTSKGGKDALAMKLSVSAGSVLWYQTFGDVMDDVVNGVALDPRQLPALGAAAVVGSFSKAVDVGAGPVMSGGNTDIFFARLAP